MRLRWCRCLRLPVLLHANNHCLICEYDQMMRAVNKFIKKYKLDFERISLYKRDILYRWIKLGFNESDILQLYYFDKSIELLELFIDEIENKYL